MRKNAIRKTGEDRIVDFFCLAVCLVMAVFCLYPLYYTLINSLNDGRDAMRGGIYFLPRCFTLENYKTVLGDKMLPMSFAVTVGRTVLGTTLSLFFTAMVSYGLSKRELMFRRFYLTVGLITMYVGGGVIPTYMLYRSMRLINTFWVYVLPGIYAFGNSVLMLNFFKKLPGALIESAYIDGASDFVILFRIILPLSKPLLATMALFIGVGHWNDWFTSAYYVLDERLMTMPALLMKLLSETDALNKLREMLSGSSALNQVGQSVTSDSIRFATLIVSILPITLAYPFLQRYFIQGMMVGSLKE